MTECFFLKKLINPVMPKFQSEVIGITFFASFKEASSI